MHDPLVAGVTYAKHLMFENSDFLEFAKLIDDQLDEFLESKQLDEFNLRVCERNRHRV